MDAKEKSRLELAKMLRELADNSSEAAIRSSLSRSYYAIYHAAYVLLGNVSHDELVDELGKVDWGLADSVKTIRRLRMQADYDPHFVLREFSGDIALFRLEARKQLEQGLLAYERILAEIAARETPREEARNDLGC